MTSTTISRDEFESWTPARRREFRQRMPRSWPDIERRLILTEMVMGLRPSPEPVIDWNLIRPTEPAERPEPVIRAIHTVDILTICAELGQFPVAQLLSARRQMPLTLFRQAAMYLAVKHCGRLSLPQIGKKFNGRHHTTVIHARNKVQADLDAGGAVFGDIVAHVERELGVG